jgi:hypothetical protein
LRRAKSASWSGGGTGWLSLGFKGTLADSGVRGTPPFAWAQGIGLGFLGECNELRKPCPSSSGAREASLKTMPRIVLPPAGRRSELIQILSNKRGCFVLAHSFQFEAAIFCSGNLSILPVANWNPGSGFKVRI